MFNWIVRASLGNRLLVLAVAVILMAYGAFTAWRTPVDVFPDLNKPLVTVITEAGGMAPQEVELLASFPIEESDQIMLVTDGGQLIRCPVDGIRIAGRNTQGVRIFKTDAEERVVSVERITEEEAEEAEEENGGSSET